MGLSEGESIMDNMEAAEEQVRADRAAAQVATRMMATGGFDRHFALDALAELHRTALDPRIKADCAREIGLILGLSPAYRDSFTGEERLSLAEHKRRVADEYGQDSPQYRAAYALWAAQWSDEAATDATDDAPTDEERPDGPPTLRLVQ